MTNQSTIDKLIEMRLTAMADAFRIQMDDPTMKEVPFEDRFGMLVDVEYSNRKNNRLKRLIRQAELEQPDASIAAIDYHSGRKLNKALINRLATCEYITEYRNIFITGATGSGKTYMACAFGMEMSLVNAMSREQTLKLYLSDLKKDYDYILIDCMPSLGMLTINALAAADSVIVPVQAHYLPLKGMTQLMKTIAKVQRQLNPSLKIDGVLLTLADMRTKLARTTEDSLRENYGKHIRIFKTVIPVAITAAESSAAGQSIYEYDKNGTVAKAYAEFTREVIQCGEKQRNKHESSLSR